MSSTVDLNSTYLKSSEQSLNLEFADSLKEKIIPKSYDSMTDNQKSLLFFCFCMKQFVYGCFWSTILTLYPAIAKNEGFTASEISFILSGNGFGGLIASLSYSWLIKRVKRRIIWSIAMASLALTTTIFSQFNSILALLNNALDYYFIINFATMMILGAARIICYNIALATTAKIYEKEVASKTSLLVTCLSGGLMIGPMMTNFFGDYFGLSYAYIFYTILFFLNIVFTCKAMPNIICELKTESDFSLFEIIKIRRNLTTLTNMIFCLTLNRVQAVGRSVFLVSNFNVSLDKLAIFNNISTAGMLSLGCFNSFLSKKLTTDQFIQYSDYYLGVLEVYLLDHYFNLVICSQACYFQLQDLQ